MLKVSSFSLIDVSSEISQEQFLILQKLMDERPKKWFLEPSQFKKYSRDNLEMLITIPLSTSTLKKLIKGSWAKFGQVQKASFTWRVSFRPVSLALDTLAIEKM